MDVTPLREVARRHGGLTLLVLHGSRARGDAHARSDWDLAWLGDAGVDPDALAADLADALGEDRVDLADLRRAGALLRFRVAAEGRPIYEAAPEAFLAFQLDATRTWCDMEPVLRRAWDAVLEAAAAGGPAAGPP